MASADKRRHSLGCASVLTWVAGKSALRREAELYLRSIDSPGPHMCALSNQANMVWTRTCMQFLQFGSIGILLKVEYKSGC